MQSSNIVIIIFVGIVILKKTKQSEMFLWHVMDNEPIYENECPTCYMSYEGNSRAQHNCLDDEGINC